MPFLSTPQSGAQASSEPGPHLTHQSLHSQSIPTQDSPASLSLSRVVPSQSDLLTPPPPSANPFSSPQVGYPAPYPYNKFSRSPLGEVRDKGSLACQSPQSVFDIDFHPLINGPAIHPRINGPTREERRANQAGFNPAVETAYPRDLQAGYRAPSPASTGPSIPSTAAADWSSQLKEDGVEQALLEIIEVPIDPGLIVPRLFSPQSTPILPELVAVLVDSTAEVYLMSIATRALIELANNYSEHAIQQRGNPAARGHHRHGDSSMQVHHARVNFYC